MSNKMTPAQGAVVRQEFGAQQMAVSGVLASEAAMAQVRAQVEARCVVADRRPRDWDVVRQRILKECERPGFADAAIYELAWAKDKDGNSVEGLSIRFAEAAMRCMGNLYPETRVVFEDKFKRIVSVSVTELETNVTISKEVIVEKTVERNKVRDGQVVIGERMNSYGKKVYLVEASEGELIAKQNAIESKVLRTAILRIFPGDLQDECWAKLESTSLNRAAKDPSAARKQLIDAFGAIGVDAEQLKRFVGHPLEQLVPKELVELRKVHAAVKDGESTWAEALEAKLEQHKNAEKERAPTEPAQGSKPDQPEQPTPRAPETTPEPPAPPPRTTGAAEGTWEYAQFQLVEAAKRGETMLALAASGLMGKADDTLKAQIKAEYARLSDAMKAAK